jgi:hypothetical protein
MDTYMQRDFSGPLVTEAPNLLCVGQVWGLEGRTGGGPGHGGHGKPRSFQ